MKAIAGISLLILVLLSPSVEGQNKEAMKKIESVRIALITERLGLTPEQAEKFWPLYREYSEKSQQLREEYLKNRQSVDSHELTDEESERLLKKGLDLKERQLELDKKYSIRLSRVITSTQLLKLRRAEEDFRKMLLERLDRRLERRERLKSSEKLRK